RKESPTSTAATGSTAAPRSSSTTTAAWSSCTGATSMPAAPSPRPWRSDQSPESTKAKPFLGFRALTPISLCSGSGPVLGEGSRIGQIHRKVLALVCLDEGRQNVEPLAFGATRRGRHQRLDLLQRCPVVRFSPDGFDFHSIALAC